MNRVGRESRQTNSDVFRTSGFGAAVAYPLARACDHSLPGSHIEVPTFKFHAQHPNEDNGNFFKLGALSRFQPSLGRNHARNTGSFVTRIYATRILFDALRLVTLGLNDCGFIYQFRH